MSVTVLAVIDNLFNIRSIHLCKIWFKWSKRIFIIQKNTKTDVETGYSDKELYHIVSVSVGETN